MKFLDVPQSGSFAGNTHAHNRAGQYRRNRRAPTQSPTPRRTAVRGLLSGASSSFASLTPAQIAAWNSFADGHPVTDKLGSSIKLTGHQWFVSIYTMTVASGGAPPTDPPVSTTVFSAAPASMTFSLATGLTVTLSGLGSADDYQFLALTAPMSAARTFANKFRQVTQAAGDASTIPFSTALYSAAFGLPVLGQRVFAKLTPINSEGVRGTPVVISTLTVA
jgi:hypothetical protein